MSNLIPIKICELAIENLNKRIAELETENNRLRAETTRTIIPESAYNELKIDAEYWKEEYRKLLEEYYKIKQSLKP